MRVGWHLCGWATDLYVVDTGVLTALSYQDEALDPIVRPFASVVGPDFILMQNNARPHSATTVMEYLEQERINFM